MTGKCANQFHWLRILPRVYKLQQLPDIRIICLHLGAVQTGLYVQEYPVTATSPQRVFN